MILFAITTSRRVCLFWLTIAAVVVASFSLGRYAARKSVEALSVRIPAGEKGQVLLYDPSSGGMKWVTPRQESTKEKSK